ARQAMWLLMLAPECLNSKDTAYREALCRVCPDAAIVYPLVQAFATMVRTRSGDLDAWRNLARTCGVSELRRFALGLSQEEEAVRAALREKWSQGQVEGQITRLKLIKRQMYGRANFDLLRLRVLQAA